MKNISLTLLSILITGSVTFAQPSLQTGLEKSGFSKLTTYDEMIGYLEDLTGSSDLVKLDYIGTSVSGKKIPALYFSESGFGSKRENLPLVMVICQQHGNEPSGKEGALIVARQLTGDKSYLLSKMDLILVPMVNIDGGEMGQRRNARNMDLNRNHVVLSEPETQAVHALFLEWMPEVTLDIHEFNAITRTWVSEGITKDAEEMLGGNTNLNIDEDILTFSKEKFLPVTGKKITDKGVRFHEYIVGSPFENDRIRFSTTNVNDGRHSFGIYNTLSFLIEGKRYGDLITEIERRTYGQVVAFGSFLETVADNSSEILGIVKNARKKIEDEDLTGTETGIRMDYFKDEDYPVIHYPVFNLNNWHHETWDFERFDAEVKTILSVELPEAYAFSDDLTDLIELLDRHQIKYEKSGKSRRALVESYLIKHVTKSFEEDKENEFVDVKVNREVESVKANSIIIYTKQPALKLIPLLLEPQSSWGFVSINSGLQFRFTEWLTEGETYPVKRIMKFEN